MSILNRAFSDSCFVIHRLGAIYDAIVIVAGLGVGSRQFSGRNFFLGRFDGSWVNEMLNVQVLVERFWGLLERAL